ncbi:hypothetical protein [Nonomuraea dietziae]|uniref:hypothetical protein n=1 Tax=Nonomuraea dietziae TaxID=65515 RepID=UPI00343E9EAC
MSNPNKQKGTAAESALVSYLVANGWPSAERRALRGEFDAGDVTGTPGLCWEVKAGIQCNRPTPKVLADWMVETEIERVNAAAEIGLLVLRVPGIGPAQAGRWPTYMTVDALAGLATDAPVLAAVTEPLATAPVQLTLASACGLLVAAGYGTPPKNGANRAA